MEQKMNWIKKIIDFFKKAIALSKEVNNLGKTEKNFVSRFWRKLKFYRKKKGGTWYLTEIGKGPSVDIPFSYWSRERPSDVKQYHETLLSTETY
jgi:hypothetical protein